ncbi:MAG: hypothetical protein CSA97_00515 [Bacteroidetes bacterium]|nr:MAG: hypothetical protein CSA97_00515 [Bacteroidota bacterium]
MTYDALHIPETKYTPGVEFREEESTLFLYGVSRPENAVEFYQPIIDWLDDYMAVANSDTALNRRLVIAIDLQYFNSVSAKYLMSIIMHAKEGLSKSVAFKVQWHYSLLDDESREWGEDMQSIAGLEFQFIEKDL